MILQPLSDARSFSHEAICKILEARGGIDPVFHFPNAFSHVTEINRLYLLYSLQSAFLLNRFIYMSLHIVRNSNVLTGKCNIFIC